MIIYIHTHYTFEMWCAFYVYSTSQFGLATFQVLNSPVWLVATVSASTGRAYTSQAW